MGGLVITRAHAVSWQEWSSVVGVCRAGETDCFMEDLPFHACVTQLIGFHFQAELCKNGSPAQHLSGYVSGRFL